MKFPAVVEWTERGYNRRARKGLLHMPRGPKGEKRPADVIGAAVMVGRIATGEVEDTKADKNPHAAALGRLGGVKDSLTGSRKNLTTTVMRSRSTSFGTTS